MKREKEKDSVQEQEGKKELPLIIPMLSGAITLICLTVSLIVAVPALTRSGGLTDETQNSDLTDDIQEPSSPDHNDNDDPNENDFINGFGSPNDSFGGDNIGYDIFVD